MSLNPISQGLHLPFVCNLSLMNICLLLIMLGTCSGYPSKPAHAQGLHLRAFGMEVIRSLPAMGAVWSCTARTLEAAWRFSQHHKHCVRAVISLTMKQHLLLGTRGAVCALRTQRVYRFLQLPTSERLKTLGGHCKAKEISLYKLVAATCIRTSGKCNSLHMLLHASSTELVALCALPSRLDVLGETDQAFPRASGLCVRIICL
jgi:hypothetical protein